MALLEIDKEHVNKILKDCADYNNLEIKDLCLICNKTENTVFKWLNGTLAIDPASLLNLQIALSQSKRKIPRSLSRVISKIRYGAILWARKNKTGNEKVEWIGELSQNNNPVFCLYKGSLVGVRDLLMKDKNLDFRAYQSVYAAIRKNCVGNREEFDITNIVDGYIERRKKRELKK